MLSALCGWFPRAGRLGPSYPVTRTGNPCECLGSVPTARGILGGHGEMSAVRMTERKYTYLPTYLPTYLCRYLLDQATSSTEVVDILTSLRDLLCVQFMFQSTYRGYDVGKLVLGEFCHPDYPLIG
ncbi:hypothetical protein VaNZ11_016596 [Volvox africanus]|uniref:Uncharacterized protein n=1 Tax=Volvox africanus TaxID=51714 RepID=A0ABQ5SPR2_9CHLO|nr:hypothetical protein VaNZ11_016596 [Volvox africanus]